MNLPNGRRRVYHVTKPDSGSLYKSGNTSLQKSKLEPDRGKCACGRRKKDASGYTYRSHTDRYMFHRSACGTEWTEHLTDIDMTNPRSPDEGLEGHKRLGNFEGSYAARSTKR